MYKPACEIKQKANGQVNMNYKARRLQKLAGLIFDLYKVCFACPFLPLFPPRRTVVLSSAEESGIFIIISSAGPVKLSEKNNIKQTACRDYRQAVLNLCSVSQSAGLR